jgi:hypothetical protein
MLVSIEKTWTYVIQIWRKAKPALVLTLIAAHDAASGLSGITTSDPLFSEARLHLGFCATQDYSRTLFES